jgi:lipopolysaccharide export system protein LptA
MIFLGRLVFAVAALGVMPALAQTSARSPLLPGGDSKAPVSINADKLEYFDKDRKLVYSGDVVAKQGAATLKASKLVILFATVNRTAAGPPASSKLPTGMLPSGGSQDVRRMDAAGPVTLIQNDQVGIGDSAVYDKVENKIYLIGHVSLSQGTNITTGDKLTYDLTTSQAQVEGGRVQSIFAPGTGDVDTAKDKSAKGNVPAGPPSKLKVPESRGAVAQSKDAR